MSSYLSQPRQYNAYVPEINSEMYGKLLEQKKEAYDKGVQKIDNTITQVASLPVYREADKKHLRDLVEGITTELNQQHGADWSDQHLNNITSKHISTIANDEGVQNAVSSTLAAKGQLQKSKDDADENGEASVANQYVFNEHFNKWLQDPTVGAKFSGNYTKYTDVNKAVEGFMKNLKPDEDINTLLAGEVDPVTGKKVNVLGSYDQIIRRYKGRDRDKVLTELNRYIDTTPGLKEQLDINAKYEYRGFDGNSFINRARQVDEGQLNSGQQYLQQLQEKLMYVKNPTKVSELQAKIKGVKKYVQDKTDGLNNPLLWLKKKNLYDIAPDEAKEEFKKQLYMDEWTRGQADMYSSGTEKSLTYAGESPFAKQMAMMNYKEKVRMDDYSMEQDKLKAEKEKKETVPHIIDLGVNPSLQGIAYERLQGDVNTNKGMIQQNKLRFLYDNLTETQRRDFFKPIQNGQIIMKNEKFIDPNTGEQTTVESYLDDVYNRFNDAFNSSNYKNGPIQLDKKQINHFIEQRRLDDIQKLSEAKIQRANEAWNNHIQTDPESIKLYNDIDRLNTSPITVASPTSGDIVTITGKDIELYSKIAKEIKDNKETGAPKDPQYDTKAQEVEAQTLAKYGMNKDKYAAIPVYANNLTKAVDQSKEDRSKFLNDQVLTGSRLYRPQEVMLTSGKEEVNVDVIKQTQAILQAAKLLTNAPYKIASKILSPAGEKSAKENINIGYWMDENTNEYKLRIGNGAEHEDVPISPQQAIQMHLSTSNPYKEIEKKLDLNANGAGSSNTADPSGIMSYENADHKGYINGGNYEVRAHYEKDEHGYYVDVYTCNVHNPKEVTRVQMDPVATLGQAEDALNEWINKNKNKK